MKLDSNFVHTPAGVRKAAALANAQRGAGSSKIGEAMAKAGEEIHGRQLEDDLVVYMNQAGVGTWTNLNSYASTNQR